MAPRTVDSTKISVLTEIRDSKDLLFGKFSNTFCKTDKEDRWKEILELAVGLGVVSQGKAWTYMRDVTWQNWRKQTVVRGMLYFGHLQPFPKLT
jgi:hypothetical protein